MSPVATYTYAGQFDPKGPVLPGGSFSPIPGRFVAVRKVSDGQLATIYTSRTKAATTVNPVQIDEDGNLTFFADPGQYTLHLVLVGGAEGVGELVTIPIDPAEAGTDADIAALTAAVDAVETTTSGLDVRVAALEDADSEVPLRLSKIGVIPGIAIGGVPAANYTILNETFDAIRAGTITTKVVIADAMGEDGYFYDGPTLDLSGISMIAEGANLNLQFSRGPRVLFQNLAEGEGGALVTDTDGIGANTYCQGIYFAGDEFAFRQDDSAIATLMFCSGYSNHTGNGDNGAYVINNGFWPTTFGCDWRCGDAVPVAQIGGPCAVRIIASDGGPIVGFAQCNLTDTITTFGGIIMDMRRVTGPEGNDSGSGTVIDGFVTENQGPQSFLQVVNTSATSQHYILRMTISRSERADAGPCDASIYVDGRGIANTAVLWAHMENCKFYCAYDVKCVNLGDAVVQGNTGGQVSGYTFDPANPPFNRGTGSYIESQFKSRYYVLADDSPNGHLNKQGRSLFGFTDDEADSYLKRSTDGLGQDWYGDGSSDTPDIGPVGRKTAHSWGVGPADALRTGVTTTAARPAAATVGKGACIWDDDLDIPIWSTGAGWVDATGASV